MALIGQAKTDYQREYMRKRRSNIRSNIRPALVRPKPLDPVRPVTEVDKRCQAKQDTVILEAAGLPPEPQSYNPMMVGYVPPKD